MAQTLTKDDEVLDAPDSLALEVNDPMVARAAQLLIQRFRQGQSFEIRAFAPAHDALADIAEQLEEEGLALSLADPFVAALRRYIMANGGSFSRAANATPVMIHMVVADRMPDRRFEKGMTELACLGPREVRVEGAARVNVRITPTGTGTTSNAADVDAMFSNVKGTFLWVRFEAPTREDLEGMMSAMENTLAGVAQSVGGAMGAAEFKELLEALKQDGALTPALNALITNLIQLQEAMAEGAAVAGADIAALTAEIAAILDNAAVDGLIPPAMVSAVMGALAEIASHPAVAALMVDQGFADLLADNDNVSVDQQIAEVLAQVEALQTIEGLDPAVADMLGDIIESAHADLAAGDITPAALLETLGEKLAGIAARADVPPALFDGIGAVLPDIAALRDSPQIIAASAENAAPVIDLAQGEAMLAVLEDIAAQVQAGEMDIADLPPAMQALIAKMGGVEILLAQEGRELRVETLSEAIAGEGEPALSEAVHAAVLVMASPQGIDGLPPQTVAIIQTFVAQNPAIVETAATQSVMRDMKAVLATLDPASADAVEIEAAIEILKAEGIQGLIDKQGDTPLPPAVEKAVENFVRDNPEAVAIVAAQAALSAPPVPAEGTPAENTAENKADEPADPQAEIPADQADNAPDEAAVEIQAADKIDAAQTAEAPDALDVVALEDGAEMSVDAPSDPVLTGGESSAPENIEQTAPPTRGVEVPANPADTTPSRFAVDSSAPAPVSPAAPATVSVEAPSTAVPAAVLAQAQVPALQSVTAALTVTQPGTPQIPAEQKAAATLITQAITQLKALPPATPPTAAQVSASVQQLVDAAAKITDPAQKEAITKVIEQVRASVSDPQNLPDKVEPTDKPGCGPLCNCHTKTGAAAPSANTPLPEKATPAIVAQMRAEMGSNPAALPGAAQGAQITVKDNGDIETRRRDGSVTTHTYQEYRASVAANDTAMRSLADKGYTTKTVSQSALMAGVAHVPPPSANKDGVHQHFNCKCGPEPGENTVKAYTQTIAQHSVQMNSDQNAAHVDVQKIQQDSRTKSMDAAFGMSLDL